MEEQIRLREMFPTATLADWREMREGYIEHIAMIRRSDIINDEAKAGIVKMIEGIIEEIDEEIALRSIYAQFLPRLS